MSHYMRDFAMAMPHQGVNTGYNENDLTRFVAFYLPSTAKAVRLSLYRLVDLAIANARRSDTADHSAFRQADAFVSLRHFGGHIAAGLVGRVGRIYSGILRRLRIWSGVLAGVDGPRPQRVLAGRLRQHAGRSFGTCHCAANLGIQENDLILKRSPR